MPPEVSLYIISLGRILHRFQKLSSQLLLRVIPKIMDFGKKASPLPFRFLEPGNTGEDFNWKGGKKWRNYFQENKSLICVAQGQKQVLGKEEF